MTALPASSNLFRPRELFARFFIVFLLAFLLPVARAQEAIVHGLEWKSVEHDKVRGRDPTFTPVARTLPVAR